ncbi:MAG: CapA family protein [Lachnospiraceae bacterium]|nr:CapA family protein [Lachnospiraceae bacterium]
MKKAISIFAVLFAVLTVLFIWFDRRMDNVYVSMDRVEFVYHTVDEENSDEKWKYLKKEEQRLKIKQELQGKLVFADEYISLKNSQKNTEEFIDWLFENYSIDVLTELSNCGKELINRDFYMNTGKSLFVLLDEFLGIKDYESKAGSSNMHVNLTFAGDICLAEDGFVLDYYDTTGGLRDCIGESIIEKANNADIFLINNEFCFSERGTALSGKLYTFRAMPKRVDILKELGADIVSLANNHVYDFGADAFLDTIGVLDEAGIRHIGGGADSTEAEKVLYYEVNGIKIGYVAASSAEKVRFTPGAGENSPGVFRMYDAARLLEVVTEADKQCDYLIAYLHWGTEDSKYFEQYQHELAQNLIAAGVDAIIGGHSHVFQGMEYIDGKPVIYSLGDFWFNSETKYTGMVNLCIDIDGLKDVTIIPCIQQNYTTKMLETGQERAGFFDYFTGLSPGVAVNEDGIVILNEENK